MTKKSKIFDNDDIDWLDEEWDVNLPIEKLIWLTNLKNK